MKSRSIGSRSIALSKQKSDGFIAMHIVEGLCPAQVTGEIGDHDRSESRMLWLLALTGGFAVGRMLVLGLAFCLNLAIV